MMEGYKRTHLKIDLDAIKSNLQQMQANVGSMTKIIGVIKADGYGHGAVPIAQYLEKEDCLFGFATATYEEAAGLRAAGIEKMLLILGHTFEYCYEQLAEKEIRPAVFREDTLEKLHVAAKKAGKKIKVHIKVDTGMSRIGIKTDSAGISFIGKVLSYEWLELEGIFTHFAKADETEKTTTMEQYRIFCDFVKKAEQLYGYVIPLKHCSNSAGIIEMKEMAMDVVRAGIGMYGLWPSVEIKRDIVSLKPALSWESTVIYVKEIEPGTPVSYGGTFVAKEQMKIATIPVGYGDGYPRTLSGKGHVLIHGKKAPILGRICMDQFMVDVTKIPETKEGNRVVLIGLDGNECLDAEYLGEVSGRFNYELVCDINKRVPRIYYAQGQIVTTKDYYQDYE